ncbi:POK9 protein, partial [Certhia familiaris]|nr:POK9 protein [Certhia familiaris]
QLRATVAQFGVTSEPAKQMLDYLFNSTVFLTPGKTHDSLAPATARSLGIDLETAVDVTLYNDAPHAISTGVRGPLKLEGQSVGGLLLGRSSGTLMGLHVMPGVIDADTEGEIFIIVSTQYPPLTIPKGQKIAQFVPLPQLANKVIPRSPLPRGEGQFGSSGEISLIAFDLTARPKKECRVYYNNWTLTLYNALLDMGADTCIIDITKYPESWPTFATSATISGIGGVQLAKRS